MENYSSWRPWDLLQFIILVSQATPTHNNNNNPPAHITVEETIQPETKQFIGVALAYSYKHEGGHGHT